MHTDFDVIIIGGGPAGAAAGISLARYTRLSVAIVEKKYSDDIYRAGESVSSAIYSLWSYLGLSSEKLHAAALESYAHAASWGSRDIVVRDFMFSSLGGGLHLNRKKFDDTLLDEAVSVGVTLFRPAELLDITNEQGWELLIKIPDAEKNLKARYLIDCSGHHSIIVKKQNRPVHKEDKLVALYAYYHENEEAQTPLQTLLETTEHGWYYLSPLPNKRVVIAFITDADILKQLGLSDPANWLAAGLKTVYISKTLSLLSEPETLRHFAIHSRAALLPDNANWTAAGDAAASFDPISSLGIGFAINSGINSARAAEAFLMGDHVISTSYNRSILKHFENYLNMRHAYYALEKRWPDAPFWQRRSKIESVGQ